MIDTDKYEALNEAIDRVINSDEIGIDDLFADSMSVKRGINELLAELRYLRKELAYYTDNCTIVWMPEDVLSLDDTLTDEEVSWVLTRMQHRHDANLGISWDTIEFWISEVKKQ